MITSVSNDADFLISVNKLLTTFKILLTISVTGVVNCLLTVNNLPVTQVSKFENSNNPLRIIEYYLKRFIM